MRKYRGKGKYYRNWKNYIENTNKRGEITKTKKPID